MTWPPFPQTPRVYLVLGATDMRQAVRGLSLIAHGLEMDVFGGDCFVFCNRRQTIIKILYYLRNGFCIWQKRLEKQRFRWPVSEEDVREIGGEVMGWLLEGLDIDQAHKKEHYSVLI